MDLPNEVWREIDTWAPRAALALVDRRRQTLLRDQCRRRQRAHVRDVLRRWSAPRTLRQVVMGDDEHHTMCVWPGCEARRLLVIVRHRLVGSSLQFWVRPSPYCRAHTDPTIRRNFVLDHITPEQSWWGYLWRAGVWLWRMLFSPE